MTFKEGLIKSRSHIIFILGLAVAFGIAIGLERWKPEKLARQEVRLAEDASIPTVQPKPLTAQEMDWAKLAWSYFENNYQPATGMVNSVDNYPASTLWDTASYLMALICAERLEIIGRDVFDQRMSLILETLANLPLFDGRLPNKSYSTTTTAMVDYNNQPTEQGIGWSAIDVGRIMVPFNILVWNYPAHTDSVRTILGRWHLDELVKDGLMYGAAVDGAGRTVMVQEGRLGYEQYAAKSLALAGLDAGRAVKYESFISWVDVYGVQVAYDSRDPSKFDAHNYVVSEPYILDGLEFGWDSSSRQLAYRVYQAQERRYQQTGILTAVSEDHIDQPPYFVYNTVFTDGKLWNCITEKGADASQFKTLSTKAAFGWHVLFRTPYTEKLIERAGKLLDPQKGWYSGEYESSGQTNRAITCNSNAIVLEAICYKKLGRSMAIERK